jgi:hypothetical protein
MIDSIFSPVQSRPTKIEPRLPMPAPGYGRRKGFRRAYALAFSVGIHSALFGAFYGFSDHSAATSPTPADRSVVWLSLIGPSSGPAQPAADASPLEQLRQRLLAQSPPTATTSEARSAGQIPDVLTELDRQARASDSSKPNPRSGPVGSPANKGELHPGQDPWARASVVDAVDPAAARTGLWSQIARCWHPPRSNVVVKLLVTLTDRGVVAAPPSVVRDAANRIDSARLAAEAEAKSAVASCGPYAIAPGAPRLYEMDFGKGDAG